MDTIFTLLIILLPIVFKLIGKKLENAGTQPQVTDSQQEPPVQARVVPQEGRPQTRKTAKPAVQPKKPVLQEEEKKRTEKIDKKKLIVYSEIMKPKYTE